MSSPGLVDYLTVVVPAGRVGSGRAAMERFVLSVLGAGAMVELGPFRGRAWQFYADSAVLVDREGECVGFLGFGGNRETVCLSISGAGCRWVRDWHRVVDVLGGYGARISRVDVAVDDYDGKVLDVHALRREAREGEGFMCSGRPPKSRFLDDHGSGDGCTLYVGAKGHKELCVYEKGKQLGDDSSPWVRAEVRMYGKHVGVIPLDVLVRPMEFLRGAYPILARLFVGLADRLATVVATVEASATAMVSWLRRQCGPSLGLLSRALGDDLGAFVVAEVARSSRPSRFRRSGAGDDLVVLVRNQLCA